MNYCYFQKGVLHYWETIDTKTISHLQDHLQECGIFVIFFTGCRMLFVIIPPLQRSWKGVYWHHLVRLSLCQSVDRIVSALYFQQYSSDPFHICTSYQATSEGVSRVMPISKFKNLHFVFFWLGIQYDSMVWVIMRRWGGILRMQAF